MTKKNENCDQKYLTKSLRIGTDQLSNTIEKKIKIVSFSRQVINMYETWTMILISKMSILIKNISLILQKMVRVKVLSLHATAENSIRKSNTKGE